MTQHMKFENETGELTATVVNENQPGFRGHVWLVELSHPVAAESMWGAGYDIKDITHLAVSAVDTGFITETYIFPADEDGDIRSWGELPGSMSGSVSHEESLERFLDAVDTDTWEVER